MNSCKVECSTNGFKIYGVINFNNVTHLYRKGIELLIKYEQLRLDFAEVSHADSSAIALLLSWIRFAKKQRRSFVFVNLPSQLLEIANVCEVMPFLLQHIVE